MKIETYKKLTAIFFLLVFLSVPYLVVAAGEDDPKEGYVPCGRDTYTLAQIAEHNTGARNYNEANKAGIKSGSVSPQRIWVAGELKNPCGFDDALVLATRLINGWIGAGVIIATLSITYAGYLYITAMGSEEKIKHAHSIFLKVTIGFAIMLSAWLVGRVLEDTFLCSDADVADGKECVSFIKPTTRDSVTGKIIDESRSFLKR